MGWKLPLRSLWITTLELEISDKDIAGRQNKSFSNNGKNKLDPKIFRE